MHPDDDAEYGRVINLLVEIRRSLGMTQEQIAKRLYCHQATVSLIENGKRIPTLTTLQLYARAVGVKLRVEVMLD